MSSLQYYYKIMNYTRIYNTVNVHKRMLHKCVNTAVIVGYSEILTLCI